MKLVVKLNNMSRGRGRGRDKSFTYNKSSSWLIVDNYKVDSVIHNLSISTKE